MLPKSPYTQSITSYSFEMRGDLPPHMGEFYRDADQSRAAFETARAAQIMPPERANAKQGRSETNWKANGFQLPDPHPSFAAPSRKRREESWFQKLNLKETGAPMSKEEFFKMRETPSNARCYDRGRDD